MKERAFHRNSKETLMMCRMVRALVIAVAIMVAPLGIASASAQTADAESAKALRELVAEVRALRTTIEQYAATQIQSQAVSDLIGVQQRRIADVTTRLDMTRRELDGSTVESRRMSAEISNSEEVLRRMTDAKERTGMEAML